MTSIPVLLPAHPAGGDLLAADSILSRGSVRESRGKPGLVRATAAVHPRSVELELPEPDPSGIPEMPLRSDALDVGGLPLVLASPDRDVVAAIDDEAKLRLHRRPHVFVGTRPPRGVE